MPPKHPRLGLIVLLVLCFAAAGIGGAVTTPKIPIWYATLVKGSTDPLHEHQGDGEDDQTAAEDADLARP
jgi:hypothetical protein